VLLCLSARFLFRSVFCVASSTVYSKFAFVERTATRSIQCIETVQSHSLSRGARLNSLSYAYYPRHSPRPPSPNLFHPIRPSREFQEVHPSTARLVRSELWRMKSIKGTHDMTLKLTKTQGTEEYSVFCAPDVECCKVQVFNSQGVLVDVKKPVLSLNLLDAPILLNQKSQAIIYFSDDCSGLVGDVSSCAVLSFPPRRTSLRLSFGWSGEIREGLWGWKSRMVTPLTFLLQPINVFPAFQGNKDLFCPATIGSFRYITNPLDTHVSTSGACVCH